VLVPDNEDVAEAVKHIQYTYESTLLRFCGLNTADEVILHARQEEIERLISTARKEVERLNKWMDNEVDMMDFNKLVADLVRTATKHRDHRPFSNLHLLQAILCSRYSPATCGR
jgi:chemotaxis regulatin CheY-phosphate phosphatase CheZ